MKNIYLCGKAGAGKTYAAKYLMEKYGYVPTKFAYPVYGIAEHYFGMKEKDRKLLQVIGTDVGRKLIDTDIWVKRLMQDLTIAKLTAKEMNLPEPLFISDDTRFPNEHKILKQHGWVGLYLEVPDEIRIKRLQGRDGTAQEQTLGHISELALDMFKDQLIAVDFSGTLEQSYTNLEAVIAQCIR